MLITQDSPPSLSIEILKMVVTALLAGVGAWIGGRWSVSREREKLRNERAFDHRLDWYCRAARGIVQMQWHLLEYKAAISAGDQTKAAGLRAERDANKASMESDQREMILFGSQETIAALNSVNLRASRALKDASGISGAADAMKELGNAYLVLANDVREHLGMERLTLEEVSATSDAFMPVTPTQK